MFWLAIYRDNFTVDISKSISLDVLLMKLLVGLAVVNLIAHANYYVLLLLSILKNLFSTPKRFLLRKTYST